MALANGNQAGGEPIAAGRSEPTSPPRRLRVIVGVDPDESTELVIANLRMLSGHGLESHLVHVLDRDADLAKARADLEAAGLGGTWIYRGSDPAHGLIEAARNQTADLIAIGAPKSKEGQVAKGLLAHSPISLLIARDVPKRPDGLGAILATDHTDYMGECIDRLLLLQPVGIRHLIVLTANEIVDGTAAVLVNGLPQFSTKAETWITERICQENMRIAARFAPYCKTVNAKSKAGIPKYIIEEALAENDADLLILGAAPRCFLERVLFGSVSYDEVVFGKYSVLALRA